MLEDLFIRLLSQIENEYDVPVEDSKSAVPMTTCYTEVVNQCRQDMVN